MLPANGSVGVCNATPSSDIVSPPLGTAFDCNVLAGRFPVPGAAGSCAGSSSELVYIQSIADAGSPDQAISTLLAGGVEIAGVGVHEKAILTVTQGPTSGSVNLEANAAALLGDDHGRKHFFNWEYTTDGTTFIRMPPTAEVKTTLTGLTPLTTVGFRVAVTIAKSPMGPWSQVVNILAL